jgi:hypothetical protein
MLTSEIAELASKQSDYQSLQIDDETLRTPIRELHEGLLRDRHTARDTVRQVVTEVEIKRDGGTLCITLPQQSSLLVPPRDPLRVHTMSPPWRG